MTISSISVASVNMLVTVKRKIAGADQKKSCSKHSTLQNVVHGVIMQGKRITGKALLNLLFILSITTKFSSFAKSSSSAYKVHSYAWDNASVI